VRKEKNRDVPNMSVTRIKDTKTDEEREQIFRKLIKMDERRRIQKRKISLLELLCVRGCTRDSVGVMGGGREV
jgi:predicted transposase YdaD